MTISERCWGEYLLHRGLDYMIYFFRAKIEKGEPTDKPIICYVVLQCNMHTQKSYKNRKL